MSSYVPDPEEVRGEWGHLEQLQRQQYPDHQQWEDCTRHNDTRSLQHENASFTSRSRVPGCPPSYAEIESNIRI